MTTIQTNKLGLDIVDIQVECTGESQTDMYFQEPVLDPVRSYVLGVSELSVPLAGEPMITNDEFLRSENLLAFVRKRHQGTMLRDLDPLTNIADPASKFSLNKYLVSSPADLIYHITQFVYDFQVYANANPVTQDANYSIVLLSSPSGILRIRASATFWNDYAIEVSEFGGELFGYDRGTIGVAFTAGMAVPSTTVLTDPEDGNRYLNSDNPEWGNSFEVCFKYSVFRYIENRLRVEVDADLAIPSNILVENGQHKLHYNIASYALIQEFKSSGTVDTNPVVNTGTIHETLSRVGNTVMKRKDTPTTDWYKLMDAANVQNLRLHLLLVRRVWDRTTSKWRLSRDKLNIRENATWFATMKFVEQF